MTKINQLIKWIFGSTDESSFEEMLFRGFCFFGFLIGVLLTMDWVIIIFTSDAVDYLVLINLLFSLSTSIVYLSMYYLSRFREKYYIVGLFIFSILICAAWYFTENGLHGSTSIFWGVVLGMILAYNPVKWHFKILATQMLVLCCVFLVEYHFPNLVVNPYKTPQSLNNTLIFAVIISSIMSFITIYFLRKSYDNERIKNQQQKALLEKTNEQKSMFFINLSHEIRTPLTLVENLLENYIERKGEDEELLIVRQNIQKMRRDVLDYLNFENLERGKIIFNDQETILLSSFLDEKIKLFIPSAKRKDIALRHTIGSDVFVKANPLAINEVLNNLLDNAVKYTPEHGSIVVNLAKNANTALLSVQNSGTEIPADQIEHLFEPFYQLSHEKRNKQGMGMGLYFVKRSLEAMGGKIQVSSNKEQGVVFSISLALSTDVNNVTIPVNTIPASPDSNPAAVSVTDSTFKINRPTLLLVEDNLELLQYLAKQLGDNYNVYVATNGAEAIKKLGEISLPDLIISDIMMDNMDGHELLEHTLADEKFAHIPFIFLTAKDEPATKAASLALGALDFITKPFLIDDLKLKIKTFTDHKKRVSEAAVRDMKTQFNNNYHLNVKQKQDETFSLNAKTYNLTPREKEIILLIKKGLKYEEIGTTLHISEHTVNRHVQNIYEKTNANSKAALIDKMFFKGGQL